MKWESDACFDCLHSR